MVITNNTKEHIKDTVDLNNFGIQFLDTQAIEDFQRLSGMAGRYSTEYQFHYINVVGRIHTGGQRLDVAIPLVMYNYHQEVSGAHIEFNLGEVGKANNDAMPLAIEKFKELEQTKMFKILSEMGFTTWEIHGLNSNHMHPEGVNGFSGTDLREQLDHPGVCYPLSTGVDVPSFSGMMQHKELYAEQIIMQYRLFNGVQNGQRLYKKGRCMAIVRGVPDKPITEWKKVENGPIDEIFGTTRPQLPKPLPPKKRPNFVLRSGLAATEGKEFSEELMELWKDCEFQVDTSLILKTNILRGRGRLQQTKVNNTWGGSNFPNQRSQRNLNEINEGLFGGMEDESNEPTLIEMKQYLVARNAYSWTELAKMSMTFISEEYWAEKLDELDELDDLQDIQAGIGTDEVSSTFTEDEYINMLEDDNIMSREKLLMLGKADLKKLVEETYGIW